jgi:CHAT domain-containing protein
LGENNPDYAKSLFALSEMYHREDQIIKALPLMLQAISIIKKTSGEENAEYADELFSLATLCREMKKYDSAMLLHEQSINIWKKILGEENVHYALHLYRTGDMMTYLWQYQKAFGYFKQALNITKRTVGENNIQYAYCLDGLAGYYYDIAEYKQALSLYLQSLALKEKLYGKEYYDDALTLHNLATTYFKMGNYEEAIPCMQRLITIVQKDTSALFQNYAYELNWEAMLYQRIGNYDKALSLYRQVLKIKEYKKAKQRYAATLRNLASLYEALNQNSKALFYLQQARISTKEISGEQSPDYANILFNLSVLYEKLNRQTPALQLCNEALSISKKLYGEKHPLYAASLVQLGKIYIQIKKPDSAEICFTRALQIQKYVLGEEHPDYINDLNNMALLQETRQKNYEAAHTFVKANQLELNYIAGTYTSLSEQEKINFENDQYYQFSYLPSLIYKYDLTQPELFQQLYANELILKGMVLNDQQSLLNSVRHSNDSAAINLYNEWHINKIMLGQQLLLQKNERLKNFDSLKEATNLLEQKLSYTSVAFRQQQMLTLKNISGKLRANKAAIEFIKFQYYNKKFTDSVLYAALIILPGDTVPKFVPLFEENQLVNLLSNIGKNENAVNRFYSESISNQKLQSNGDTLYKLIWKPLEKYLSKINVVYYAPAGFLHRIAFQALPVNSSQFLIDKYRMNQMLSTRSVALPQATVQKPSQINTWGNIQYDFEKNSEGRNYQSTQKSTGTAIHTSAGYINDTTKLFGYKWPRLYATKIEMDTIKKIFTNAGIDVSALTDTFATEEAFKSLDAKGPQVLHIATHGFFWPANDKLNNIFTAQRDPMFRSGLVLARGNAIWANQKIIAGKDDGILTSYEIAQMDLSNTDLVVLSACETALGDLESNEGVIGLQRAFKLAGVKQIIMSLWRVSDKQTAELMSLFYSNWLQGQSIREALRSAQLYMKAKYPPYDWAGFVLVE